MTIDSKPAATDGKRPWSTKKKLLVGGGAAFVVFAIIGQCAGQPEKTDDDTPAVSAPTTSSVAAAPEPTPEPTPEPEPAPAPMTDDEVRQVMQTYIDERSEAGVMIAQSVTAVDVADGVVTVHLDPNPTVLELTMDTFDDNLAELFGTPIAFNDEDGTRARLTIQRVDVVDANGASLGSMSTDELNRKAAG